MLLSVFTPSHRTERLPELYESLKKQSHSDREWIILLNNWAEYTNDDPRVKIYKDLYEWPYKTFVGRLKLEACKLCTWERFIELDHDDLLTETALEEVAKVPEWYAMCYSDTVNITRPNIETISRSNHFWRRYTPFNFRWKEVYTAISANPYPQSISRIRFAPNHLRARRKDDYFAIWWHEPSQEISDDHDLMCRTYLYWKMYHIEKPLYIYRVRWDNTRQLHAADIQTTMRDNHDKYFEKMMMKRCKENNLKMIDIWWALNSPEWYDTVDRHNSNYDMDLNETWKFSDNSVWLLRAHHILEHLNNPIHTMNEAYRVLKHWWIFEIEVPSDCWITIDWYYHPPYWASCDPTHVSRRNKRSFEYYTNPTMRKFIEPECNCKFTVIKPAQEILMYGTVPVVKITLMALKEWERYYGENLRDY